MTHSKQVASFATPQKLRNSPYIFLRLMFECTRRCVVRERDPERATFAGVERMHVAGHAGRHHPRRDRARIEKCAIDDRARRVHAATDAGRAHARTLALALRLEKLVDHEEVVCYELKVGPSLKGSFAAVAQGKVSEVPAPTDGHPNGPTLPITIYYLRFTSS